MQQHLNIPLSSDIWEVRDVPPGRFGLASRKGPSFEGGQQWEIIEVDDRPVQQGDVVSYSAMLHEGTQNIRSLLGRIFRKNPSTGTGVFYTLTPSNADVPVVRVEASFGGVPCTLLVSQNRETIRRLLTDGDPCQNRQQWDDHLALSFSVSPTTSAQPLETSEHSEFPYMLDQASLKEHFPIVLHGLSGVDAARALLEEHLKIHVLWQSVCFLTQYRYKLKATTRVIAQPGIPSLARHAEVTSQGTVFAQPFTILYLPLAEIPHDLNTAEADIVWLFLQKILARAPNHQFLQGALLQVGRRLYSEHFDRLLGGVQGDTPRFLLPGDPGSFGIPEGFFEGTSPGFSGIGIATHADLLWRLLGKMHEERLANFRKIAVICSMRERLEYQHSSSQSTVPLSAPISLESGESLSFEYQQSLTLDEWLVACDRVIPDFRERYLQEPVTRPWASGSRALWVPYYQLPEQTKGRSRKAAWGAVMAVAVQAPGDSSQGIVTAQSLPVRLRISVKGFESVIYDADGWADVNPQSIDTMANTAAMEPRIRKQWKTATQRNFTVEAAIGPDDHWVTIGGTFRIDETDTKMMKDSRVLLDHIGGAS